VKFSKTLAPLLQVYEEVLSDVNQQPPGGASELFWLYDSPSGLRDMLRWISERYKRPEMWITENGFAVKGESDMPVGQALQDMDRVKYFR
jgi:beta-glucosidase